MEHDPMSSLPPDYWQALSLLAKASHQYRHATGHRVGIVGGAAVSFYTQGQILSGDFDIVGDTGFEPFLLSEGFRKEDRPGQILRGYYHLEVPRLGFEFVSGALFDGRSDRDRLLAVRVAGDAEVIFPAVEDLIADRLGQYASSGNKDREMLEQARLLLSLASEYDRDYIVRRINEESGDPAEIEMT
jgi:hypothetical protein